MSRCWICTPVGRHQPDYGVSIGLQDVYLRVCRWCLEDLTLFGVKVNQIIALPTKPRRHFPASLLVLGPVRSVLTEAET
jgi:hypothetical protein